jgi:hypothetical protein
MLERQTDPRKRICHKSCSAEICIEDAVLTWVAKLQDLAMQRGARRE